MFVGTRQSGGSSRGSGRVGTRGGSRRCRERGKGPSGRTRGWERATRREGRRHRGAPRAPTRRRRRRRRVSARGWTTHARTRFRGVGHRECVSRVRPKSLRPERGRGWRHPRDAHAASASTRERTRARGTVREAGPTRRSTRRVAIDKRHLQPSASGRSIGERCHIPRVAPPTRGEDAECAARGARSSATVAMVRTNPARASSRASSPTSPSRPRLPDAPHAFAVAGLPRVSVSSPPALTPVLTFRSADRGGVREEVKVLVVGNGAVGDVHDEALLPGQLHRRVQEDHRRGFPREDAIRRRASRGRAAHGVGHRRAGGVRHHHKNVLSRVRLSSTPAAAPIPVLPASSLALTRPLASSPHPLSQLARVLVFSTTDRASFDAIRRWRDKVEEQCSPIAMCICQNKVDLIDDAAVDRADEARRASSDSNCTASASRMTSTWTPSSTTS